MKIHLSHIPPEGVRREISLPLASMTRLIEAIGEQEGNVEASLLLKNRQGAVEITGHVRAILKPPCQRCLEPVETVLEEDVLVALVRTEEYEETAEALHLGAAELEVSFYEGDELNLTQVLEDEIMLLLPEPVVEEGEDERCVLCGKRMEDLYASGDWEEEDHPFAPLKNMITAD